MTETEEESHFKNTSQVVMETVTGGLCFCSQWDVIWAFGVACEYLQHKTFWNCLH